MKVTETDLNDFLDSIYFSKVNNENDLDYQDPFATAQQKRRDAQITELLTECVKFYKRKVAHSSICRYMILVPCILIICFFSGVLLYFSVRIMKADSQVEMSDMISFATTCISFITLIIGLLTIITKYFFPENDEQHIATIVKTIQKNDLENKREYAKYKQNMSDLLDGKLNISKQIVHSRRK